MENKLTEDYRKFLSDPSVPEERGRELQQRVDALSPQQQRSFLDRIAPILNERLKVLEEKQIDINLLRRAREVQAYINQLPKEPEVKVRSITPSPPTETKGERTFTERLQEKWEEHPVRTTLTGTVIVLGALNLATWVADRFRKAKDAGKEAAQKVVETGGSWLKKTLIAIGVTLGVFLGIKAYGEYKEFKGLLQWRKPEKPRPPEQPAPVQPEPDSGDQPPDTPVSPEALSQEPLKLIGEGLLLLHEDEAGKIVEQCDISEENLRKALVSLLQQEEIQNTLTLSQLMTVDSVEGARSLLEALPGKQFSNELLQRYAVALLFLARALHNRERSLTTMIQREGDGRDVGSLTLKECLDRIGELPRILRRIFHSLEGKDIDEIHVDKLLSAVFSGEGERGLELFTHPTCLKRVEEIGREVYGEALPKDFKQRILSCCVKYRNRLTASMTGETKEEVVLRKILDDVRSNESYFLLYTQGRPATEEALREQFKHMTVGDAVQLFLYAHLAHGKLPDAPSPDILKSGDGMGSFLLQLKILDLVGQRDKRRGFEIGEGKKFKHALLFGAKEISLPPEALGLLGTLAEWGIEQAADGLVGMSKEILKEFCAFLIETHKAHGKWLLPTEVGVPVGGYLSYAALRNLRDPWHVRMEQELLNFQAKKYGRIRRLFTPKYVLEARLATGNIQGVLNQTHAALQGLGERGEEALRAYKILHRRGYHASSFERLRAAVNEIRDTAVRDEVLMNIAKLERKSKLLEYMRFSFLRRQVRWLRGRGPIDITGRPQPRPPHTPSGRVPALFEDKEFLKTLSRAGVSPDDARALLELAEEAGNIKLDPKTIGLIRQSPKAKQIIAGAIETADIDEVARALTAAKNAAKLRVGLNAVGAVGDVFGIYMAYADWQANGKRIEETNNPALKELYSDANIVYGAEGTASAAGLVIGGTAIVSSFLAGEGALAALGAAGGTVMLPIAVAVGVGGYSYRKLEGVTETWLKDESDWAKETPGTLRTKMKEMGPGKQGYWQQAARGTRAEVWFRKIFTGSDYRKWEEEHFNRIEDANEQTRYLITRAYMAKQTMLPQNPGESDHDFEERYARYQGDQIRFIIKMSDGTMDVMTDLYYQAHIHAELMELSRDLQEKHESRIITFSLYNAEGKLVEKQCDLKDYQELTSKYDLTLLNADGVCALYVIHNYEKQKREGVLMQLNIMKELTKGQPDSRHMIDKSLQHSLLMEVRNDLALFERKSLEADYKGWGWTGGEEESRSLTNLVLSNKLRLLLREYSDRFQSKEAGPTLEEYGEAISKLRSLLQTDPIQFYRESMGRKYEATREAKREHSSVYTSLSWIMQNLHVYQPRRKGSTGIGSLGKA